MSRALYIALALAACDRNPPSAVPADAVPDAATVTAPCPEVSAELDRDADGIADGVDNCPDLANVDQLDTDEDGPGDACDGCSDCLPCGVGPDHDEDGDQGVVQWGCTVIWQDGVWNLTNGAPQPIALASGRTTMTLGSLRALSTDHLCRVTGNPEKINGAFIERYPMSFELFASRTTRFAYVEVIQ